MGLGKLLLLLGSTVVVLFGCSAPESTKTPLIVCTAGEKGCPQERAPAGNIPKQGTNNTSGGPSGAPTQAAPPDSPPGTPPKKAPVVDADGGAGSGGGGEDPPPDEPLGPICTKLEDCCQQLANQGYDPATCQSMVDTKNENACSLQRKQYTDFGDCTL